MATLLSLVNAVLPEIGFPQLTTVVGNSNQTARLALALANREGRSLAKFNWRILVKRNVITTVSSADSYTLPSDFDRFIHNTEWNDTADTKMSGPISDPLWQADLSGIGYVSINDRFQLRADGNNARIFVRPIPTSAENLTFFYASTGWCTSNGGQRQTVFAADTDILLLNDYVFELGLKWRMLQGHRREYQIELIEYVRERDKLRARDGGMATLRILGPTEETDFRANIPETGFGA